MSTIIQNGKVIHVNGTLSMTNGQWYVNGKPVNLADLAKEQSDQDTKSPNITIELHDCQIDHLDVDYCNTITINGDVKRVKTNSGDIRISGNVDGDVHTNMGDIDCGDIHGDCHTNMGNIRRK